MSPDALQDLFAPLGPVTVRRMFAGHGVYLGTACFIIAAKSGLWVKADAAGAKALAAAGQKPFSVTRADGKVIAMKSFWSLPEAALDDEEELLRWCRPAIAEAQKVAAEKAAALTAKRKRAGN